MAVTAEQVHEKTQRLPDGELYGKRGWLDLLAPHIDIREDIFSVTEGFYKNNNWLVAVTSDRLLFVRKNRASEKYAETIPTQNIQNVSLVKGALLAKAYVKIFGTEHVIDNLPRNCADEFVHALTLASGNTSSGQGIQQSPATPLPWRLNQRDKITALVWFTVSFVLLALAFWGIQYSWKKQTITLVDERYFTPAYIVEEVEDISAFGARRYKAHITVPDGLNENTLSRNIIHAAQTLINKKRAAGVVVWAHRKSDATRLQYSAAACTLAPFGDLDKTSASDAVPENMQAFVLFNDAYFQTPYGMETVERIPEESRKGIFKSVNAAKRMESEAFEKNLVALALLAGHPTASQEDIVKASDMTQEIARPQIEKIQAKHGLSEQELRYIDLEGEAKRWDVY